MNYPDALSRDIYAERALQRQRKAYREFRKRYQQLRRPTVRRAMQKAVVQWAKKYAKETIEDGRPQLQTEYDLPKIVMESLFGDDIFTVLEDMA